MRKDFADSGVWQAAVQTFYFLMVHLIRSWIKTRKSLSERGTLVLVWLCNKYKLPPWLTHFSSFAQQKPAKFSALNDHWNQTSSTPSQVFGAELPSWGLQHSGHVQLCSGGTGAPQVWDLGMQECPQGLGCKSPAPRALPAVRSRGCAEHRVGFQQICPSPSLFFSFSCTAKCCQMWDLLLKHGSVTGMKQLRCKQAFSPGTEPHVAITAIIS